MRGPLTVTKRVHFRPTRKGRREMRPGPTPVVDTPASRVPRLARLMALAIKFDQMLASGAVRDQAQLAEVGHVSRPRVTQIMDLLHLAPDIQEAILFLPVVTEGDDPIVERHVRATAAEPRWERQREMWG